MLVYVTYHCSVALLQKGKLGPLGALLPIRASRSFKRKFPDLKVTSQDFSVVLVLIL